MSAGDTVLPSGMPLGLTFPFNILRGIPLCSGVAQRLLS